MAWVLAWAAVPVAAGLLPGSYLATVGTQPIPAARDGRAVSAGRRAEGNRWETGASNPA